MPLVVAFPLPLLATNPLTRLATLRLLSALATPRPAFHPHLSATTSDDHSRRLSANSVSILIVWQKAKYKAHEFGACPRTLCEKQTVLPVGLSDSVSLTGENPMKLFCARCQQLYDHNVPGGNYIDGAFFGTTFPHLFVQTYHELRPPPCSATYVPRVFGFKVHKSAEKQQLTPQQLEEWPKRPRDEPISDWDS